MSIIKKFFKNIIKPSDVVQQKTVEYDLDDRASQIELEKYLKVEKVTKPDSAKADSEIKKKPGRPKRATAKKTPSKKTPSKKIS